MFGLQEESFDTSMDSQDNKRKWKNRDFTSNLEFAITGILLRQERRNMRKHISALTAILAGLVFKDFCDRVALLCSVSPW